MKASELRALTPKELGAKAEELRKELMKLRFLHSTNQLENPMRLRHIRKDVARIETILREKRLKSEVGHGEGK